MWQYHIHGSGDGGGGEDGHGQSPVAVDTGKRMAERAVIGGGLRGLAGEDGPVGTRRFEGRKGGYWPIIWRARERKIGGSGMKCLAMGSTERMAAFCKAAKRLELSFVETTKESKTSFVFAMIQVKVEGELRIYRIINYD